MPGAGLRGAGQRGPDGAQGVPAGFDERARDRPDPGGQGVQGTGRHEQLLSEGAGPAAADSDLEPLRAQMLPPAETAPAPPAAEHGVPDDALPDPGGGRLIPGPGDDPAPLVADADGVARLAGTQVGHVPGEEFHVRAAHAGPLDIHDDLAGGRRRRIDVLHRAMAGPGDHECAHARLPAGPGAGREGRNGNVHGDPNIRPRCEEAGEDG